jgi:hypothetical protein
MIEDFEEKQKPEFEYSNGGVEFRGYELGGQLVLIVDRHDKISAFRSQDEFDESIFRYIDHMELEDGDLHVMYGVKKEMEEGYDVKNEFVELEEVENPETLSAEYTLDNI